MKGGTALRAVRCACAGVLVGVVSVAVAGEPSKPADPIQVAIDALAAPSADVRAEAATRLGGIWPAGVRGAPFLVIALEDEDARVRDAAFGALLALAEPAAPIGVESMADLEGPDAEMLRALGAAVTTTDLAYGFEYRGVTNLYGLVQPGWAFTALALWPLETGTTRSADLRGARLSFVAAAAARDAHVNTWYAERAAAAAVLRALEVARRLGFSRPFALTGDLRARLVASARAPNASTALLALRCLRLARAAGPDVREAALPALSGSGLAASTALEILAGSGPDPRVAALLRTSNGLATAVFRLEADGAWWALEAMVQNPNPFVRAAAARALLAAGRGGGPAAEAFTAGLKVDVEDDVDGVSPLDFGDGGLREAVVAAVRAGDVHRGRLEERLPNLTPPRRLALADALARAVPGDAAEARRREEIGRAADLLRDPGGGPAHGSPASRVHRAVADVLLAISEGDDALARARDVLRDPALDQWGVQRAVAALVRLGPSARVAAPDVELALVRMMSGAPDRGLPPVGRPTLARLKAGGRWADQRFEAVAALLETLGGFGGAATGAVPAVKRVRDDAVDARIAHVAARTLRRIAAK